MILYSSHLENTGSMSYADIPNVTHFVIQYQKITFINITLDLKRRALGTGKFSSLLKADTCCPNLSFSLNATLYH